MSWSEQAARYLSGSTTCPRCDRGPVGPESCPFCGAILVGPVADELREVSDEAVAVLVRRNEVIDRLPTKAAFAAPPTGAPATGSPAAPAPTAVPAPVPAAVAAPRTSSQVSLQSVLAVAGAVLVAVAIIVFRFFNVDVDITVRRVVIGVVTLVFLGFAWLLARVKLRFSAEAVGALTMVFVALDIWAISELVPGDVSPWTFAAISTLVASVLTLLIAAIVRLRTWLWLGLLGLVFVPAFFGYAVDGVWSSTVGHLGSVAVALVAHEVAVRLAGRFDSPLLADRATTTGAAALFGVVVLAGLPRIAGEFDERAPWVLGCAIAVAVLAGLALLATRTLAVPAWSAAAGVLATTAVGILPFAAELDDASWWLALVPAAATVAVAALAFVPWPARVHRTAVRVGALLVALGAAVPAALVAVGLVFTPLLTGTRWGVVPGDLWTDPMERYGIIPADTGLAAILGTLAATAVALVVGLAVRRDGGELRSWAVLAAWIGALAVAAAPGWPALSRPGQVVAAVVVAAGIPLLLLLVPRLRVAALAYKVPFLVAAHVAVAYAAALSWPDERLTVAGGAAAVAALVALAMAMPAGARPFYVVAGYAYALLLFARGLDLLGVDPIPTISYTATVASLFALGVTLVRRVRAQLWYAVLAVTAVPFVIGVVTVIVERTWETALANAAIFALALTLTLTRRPGLTRVVRSIAAALMLPALAVVLVNVVPRILETDVVPAWNGGGGAPVTLPIIAALVALVLPSTPLMADWLRRGEVPEADVLSARWWIEISAFVTGGIAALLSLFRETAGLDTSLVVFLVLGIGGAAAAAFAKRRYGWWLAAGAWTAALWCVWGLAGIADAEPYVYPPAVAAVIIGVVLTIRGRAGIALVAPGLAIALVTSLLVLAASGSGPDALLPWRALTLLAASAVLLVIGILLGRADGTWKVAALRVPVLVAAIGAAAAGPIESARLAAGYDVVAGAPVSLLVLGFSLVAAALAAVAGRFLRPTRRWALVPALVFLIVGPIALAPRNETWMLWGLTLALLALMIVTVLRALRGSTILPPTWIVFAAAWCGGVAGWSTRELNVEWFSLPLGLALTAAGALVLRRGATETPRAFVQWPVTFTGSWAVLAPGIVVTVLPSVLATGTNPATWRAILVIALALVALLIGALGRYAAPFVLSLVTFGVELIVILFQLTVGRDIDLVVFYVAAGTAGAILITVAIWFERRSRGDQQTQARMRDLR